jgi:hypothetical protein
VIRAPHAIVRFAIIVVCAAGACVEPQRIDDNAGWLEHQASAREHQLAAEAYEHRAEAAGELAANGYNFVCQDDVLNDQLRSGGLPVTTWVPCWNAGEEAAAHASYLAERERRLARREARAAVALDDAARRACAPIAPREREHSPFAHRAEIASVVPIREHGALRGVLVAFAPVRGLDAAWLSADIACHRALWRLHGSDPKQDPDDPTLVRGARVDVFDRGGRVEVEIRGDDAAALVALARARGELLAER